MKLRGIIFGLAFVLSVSIFSCAPRHPLLPEGNDKQALTDPRIVYGALPNGFQYILLKNTTPKDRVNVHLNVFAGSMHEKDQQQGLAHYLEHMLFNGSEHFKPGELIEYFQKIGMDFGADANAHTSFFNTVYDLSLPQGDKKHLNEAFTVIQDYAKGALLLPEEIERERGIILAEKRERDSVSYRTFKRTLSFELPDSLWANRLPIGVESVLKSAGRKELKAYYDQWYRPDNMALIVVGDMDVKVAELMIVERFSKLAARSQNPPRAINTSWKQHKGLNTFFHYEPEAGNTDVTIETITWKPFERQTLADLKQETLSTIANMMLQNRLSRMITKQTADFSQASVFSGTYLKHLALSAISATCEDGQWETTLSQLENTLRQAIKYGFQKNELDRVKAEYLSMLDTRERQDATQKSSNIAGRLLRRINRKELLLSASQQKEVLEPFISGLSLSDAHDALKTAWSAEHRLVLVTGNSNILSKSPETIIRDQYQKASQTAVTPYSGFVSKTFPYLTIPTNKAHVSKKERFKNQDITRYIFQNNTVVNFKKTGYEKNKLLFNVRFGTGLAHAPKGDQGLAYLAERVVLHSGLGNLDKDQLEEALAGKNVSFSFDIKENHFSFNGSADPKEIQLVFQLVYHFLNDPGFRTESLNLAQALYQQEYEGLLRTPDGMMQIHGTHFLAGEDFRFGLPAPEVMSAYTLKKIKDWLVPIFLHAPIEISIVGDIDETSVIEYSNKYLAAFSDRREALSDKVALQTLNFPAGQKKSYTLDTKIKSGVVHYAFKTDDFWDIKQTRRLSMLSRIISERLRIEIREKLGAAYSPYAYNAPSLLFEKYGLLHIVVQVEPGMHAFVSDNIKKIVNDIQKKGITPKETQLVLRPVMNHIKVLRENNRYWLNSVLTNSYIYPQKLVWSSNMVEDYESINHNDLWQLAKTYLQFENGAVIFIDAAE